MIYPSIDKLLEMADSKYSLSVATAKRARKLKEGSQILIAKPNSKKHVGIALEEFVAGKIFIESK